MERSPAGYSPWGHKEFDRTEQISIEQQKEKTHGFKVTNSLKDTQRIPQSDKSVLSLFESTKC